MITRDPPAVPKVRRYRPSWKRDEKRLQDHEEELMKGLRASLPSPVNPRYVPSLEPVLFADPIGGDSFALAIGEERYIALPVLDRGIVRLYAGMDYIGTTTAIEIVLLVGLNDKAYNPWVPLRKKEGVSWAGCPIVLTNNERAGIRVKNFGTRPLRCRLRLRGVQGKQIQ